MSVGSHKCTLKHFENKNCLIFPGLNYVINRQIFIFILISSLSNEWNLLWRMLLIEKQPACFNPWCSHSHSFLEACFQSNSLFWPSLIMLFFTLYSALKICFLSSDCMYGGEAREQGMLGEPWGFLGSTGAPHQPPQERLTDYYAKFAWDQMLSLFPSVMFYMTWALFLFFFSACWQREILQPFQKPSSAMQFRGDQKEKHLLELAHLILPSKGGKDADQGHSVS